jgi:aspartate/methionine/tyrosine aminotransferase
MVTHGAVGALMSVVLALLDDGDEVLVPDPCWPNYLNIVKMGRATAVPFSLRAEAGYLPDLAEMRALITPRTKAIMINTPGNPTGAVFPPELVKGLVDLAIEHDLYLVSDEVYEALVFEGQHFSTAQCDLQHVIAISSVSKTYAMTGWRLGWAVGDPKVIALATKLHEMLLSCPSSVSQRAAEAALTGPQDSVARMRDAYRARRDLVVDLLKAHDLLGSVPHGAFYAMVDLRHLRRPSLDLALALLDEQRVAVAPGSTFGQVAEGMVRISLAAADDQLREGCRRIITFAGRG